MKTRLVKIAAIAVSACLCAVAGSRSAHAQTTEPPPVKMGLWQTESNSTISGLPSSAAGAAAQHATVTQGCLTPETWKHDLETMNSPKSDCKVLDRHQDATSISAELTCNQHGNSSTVHFHGQIEDSKHMRGTANMQMSMPGMPQPMTMQMSFTSKYVGSDCGDVKPGEGKVISQK